VGFYRSIKQDDDLKSIPIIMITGVSGEFEKFISSRKQVPPPEGYIQKPIEKAELLEMVQRLTA
jgi:CheY-like chemotaxis protein